MKELSLIPVHFLERVDLLLRDRSHRQLLFVTVVDIVGRHHSDQRIDDQGNAEKNKDGNQQSFNNIFEHKFSKRGLCPLSCPF